MGKRSKVLENRKRFQLAMLSQRKRIVSGKIPFTCPKCYRVSLSVDKRKLVITFICPRCNLSISIPKHPLFEVIDHYNHLCDYVWSGKRKEYFYISLSKEIYEEISKCEAVKVCVREVYEKVRM